MGIAEVLESRRQSEEREYMKPPNAKLTSGALDAPKPE